MKRKLKETASGGATSAVSVAGFRDFLLADKVTSGSKKKKKQTMVPVMTRYGFKLVSENVKPFLFSDFLVETEDSDFDPTQVVAKLKNAAKHSDAAKTQGTAAFALEDDQGRMVKVWIAREQAEDFEDALQNALQSNGTDDDDENTQKEIAEVLWELRNKFDIVNVEWKDDMPEDLEEIVEPGEEGEGGEGDPAADLEGDPAAGEEGDDLEMDADTAPPEDDADVKSTLSSVIDMMKADAEARKAEADARSKEADARIAGVEKQEAEAKVKQEEEILDMEAYNDNKKKEEDEGKRLAQLAKYKHDMADETNRDEIRHGGEEEEEYVLPKKSRFMRSNYRKRMDDERSDYKDTRHQPREKGMEYRKRMKNKKPKFRDMLYRGGY